jgi:hypothetical protein
MSTYMKVLNRCSGPWWGIILSTLLLSACLETKDHDSNILRPNQHRGTDTTASSPTSVENTPRPAEKSTLGALSHNTSQPTPPTPQGEEKRVALVIGNGAYKDLPTLDKTLNDAQDLAAALQKLGFTVIHKENVSTKQELEKVLQTLAQQLKGAKLGVFFYAGHGVQYQGENYLIPTDIQIPSDAFNDDHKVKENAAKPIVEQFVTADTVLATLENTKIPTKVIILDACRENPFLGGLATMQPKARYGGGTFVAYSTQPNNVAQDGKGRNSPYTESLLQFIDQSNLPIEMLFKKVATAVNEKTGGTQVPWVSTALLGGDLCLAGCFSSSALGVKSNSGYCTTKVGEGLYQGQCQNGLPHGQGVMKYQSGEYYKGSFSNGLRHGQGVQYLPDGMEITGKFCNGRLCN